MAYEFHVSSKAFGLINGPEANLRMVPIGVEAQKCLRGCFKWLVLLTDNRASVVFFFEGHGRKQCFLRRINS